jgi:hypothetical protein
MHLERAMSGLRLVTLIFVVVAALGLPAGALASPPQPVSITNALTFEDPDSPFSTTGGVVCATGTVSTSFALFVGGQNGRHAQLLVGKHFVCPNGTFDLLLRVTLDFATNVTQGTWSVTGSSGALAGLHGGGQITGVPIVVGESIRDEYTGQMHIDP